MDREARCSPATAQNSPQQLHLMIGFNETKDLIPCINTTQAFRTLGVYISPSGCQNQVEILRTAAQDYHDQLRSSTLTISEAYMSYFLYLCPKLTYPLPCCTLTPVQCHRIQAPAFAALLPKLHFSRHSPHAVLFAGPKYGGLSCPDLYIDQGYGQLTLFIGHLKLADDIGQLILSFLSHLQLYPQY